jgi:hypothetical protein
MRPSPQAFHQLGVTETSRKRMARSAGQLTVPQIQVHAIVVLPPTVDMRLAKSATYEADTLSTLQAELDATKMARKKYRFIKVVSIKPTK